MFGVRLTSLFHSRWMALAWAILICLYAVQFVAGRDGATSGTAKAASTAQKADDADAAMDQADAQTAQQVNAVLKALN